MKSDVYIGYNACGCILPGEEVRQYAERLTLEEGDK